MNNNGQDINDFFKSRLGNDEAAYSPAHWEQFEKLLDKKSPPKKPSFPLWKAGAVVLIALLIEGGFFYHKANKTVPQAQKQQVLAMNSKHEDVAASRQNNGLGTKNVGASSSLNADEGEASSSARTYSGLPEVTEAVQGQQGKLKKTTTSASRKASASVGRKPGEFGDIMITKEIQTVSETEGALKNQGAFLSQSVSPQTVNAQPATEDAKTANEQKKPEAVAVNGKKPELKKDKGPEKESRISLGFYGGVDFHSTYSNIKKRTPVSTGFAIGLSAEYGLGGTAVLAAEPMLSYSAGHSLYSLQTETSQNSSAITAATVKHLLNFSLPVLFKFSPAPMHSLYIGGFAGSRLLSFADYQRTDAASGSASQGTYSTAYSRGIKALNYGIGMGYSLQTSGRLCFSLRYLQGVRDLTDDSVFGQGRKDYSSEFLIQTAFRLF
jgi:hypothetical protein